MCEEIVFLAAGGDFKECLNFALKSWTTWTPFACAEKTKAKNFLMDVVNHPLMQDFIGQTIKWKLKKVQVQRSVQTIKLYL